MTKRDRSMGMEIIPPHGGMERAKSLEERLPDLMMPPAPLDSAWLGRIRWNAVAGLVRAYQNAVTEVKNAQHALTELDQAVLERERMKRTLANAEEIHEEDAKRRRARLLAAEEELAEAEHQARIRKIQREQELKDARESARPKPPTKDANKTGVERMIEALEEVSRSEQAIRAWLEGERAREIRRAGGEEHLSKAQREHLEDLEMRVDDEIRKLRQGER